MTRWNIRELYLSYAGRTLLAPGAHLAETEASLSWTPGTEAVPLVGAASAHLVDKGNASGTLSLPICQDYPDAEAALAAMAEQQAWAQAHATGELQLAVPGVSLRYKAALQELTTKSELAPAGIRLTSSWSFLLAAAEEASNSGGGEGEEGNGSTSTPEEREVEISPIDPAFYNGNGSNLVILRLSASLGLPEVLTEIILPVQAGRGELLVCIGLTRQPLALLDLYAKNSLVFCDTSSDAFLEWQRLSQEQEIMAYSDGQAFYIRPTTPLRWQEGDYLSIRLKSGQDLINNDTPWVLDCSAMSSDECDFGFSNGYSFCCYYHYSVRGYDL